MSTWQTYNGTLAKMKRSGMTLQQIGDRVGITRERVRQILKYRFGEVHSAYITEAAVGRVVGSTYRITELRKRGLVNPKRLSYWYLYGPEEVAKALKLLDRFCICGVRLATKGYQKYCLECRKKKRRCNYQYLSAEAKAKHKLLCARWIKDNPERARALNRRAWLKYQTRTRAEHYEKTRYVVVAGKSLPTGSIIKAVGCQGSQLMLVDGSKLSVSCVRTILDSVLGTPRVQ